MWGHWWYPLFQTLDDSAHEFQSEGGSIITGTLLSLALNDPQNHLWLLERGIKPRLLTPEASTTPLGHLSKVRTGWILGRKRTLRTSQPRSDLQLFKRKEDCHSHTENQCPEITNNMVKSSFTILGVTLTKNRVVFIFIQIRLLTPCL